MVNELMGDFHMAQAARETSVEPANLPAAPNTATKPRNLPPPLPDRQLPLTTPPVTTAPLSVPTNRASIRHLNADNVVRESPAPFLPPKRISQQSANNVRYTRDSHKLVAYLIPLPEPIDAEDDFPQRYLIYTPPAPHLLKPAEGIKESKRHKGKRFWQREVKKAKTYDGKTVSIKGLHSKTLRGVVWAINAIKPTDVTFLNRVPKKEMEELHIIYPPSVDIDPVALRSEFIAQMQRTKTRAKKHAAIATILLPITLAIDTFAAVIWPFGGLFEVDVVWAYSSIRGYKRSRSMTKRLEGQDSIHDYENAQTTDRELYLRFQQSEQLVTLERYVAEMCHKADPVNFKSPGVPPTETEVLAAMGWTPDLRGRRVEDGRGWRDWEDERWQDREMRDDLAGVIRKGAKSWKAWCKKYEKKPEKAIKK